MFSSLISGLWPFFVFIIVILVLLTVVSQKLKGRKSVLSENTPNKDYRYISTGFLFTPTEIQFLKVLESIAGNRFNVYGKVRISDLLKPDVNKWEKGSNWHKMFSQICQKHVDYVLTDNDYNVLCAIELNDPSHDEPRRIRRDNLVDDAFKSAGLPLLWIKAESEYLEEEISKLIAEVITSPSSD
ncbi:MAG: hypothetical protein ISEC1_P2073 [Thiomicrorhabdus sp.]|nr:MAG: hypothetical protein ISEC1_P2073 [Thiomicrorhabdus sp.]